MGLVLGIHKNHEFTNEYPYCSMLVHCIFSIAYSHITVSLWTIHCACFMEIVYWHTEVTVHLSPEIFDCIRMMNFDPFSLPCAVKHQSCHLS